MTGQGTKDGLADEWREGNSRKVARIAPGRCEITPECIVVESIVLRLFKKLPKHPLFRQFLRFF
jgi:hypothetical protein